MNNDMTRVKRIYFLLIGGLGIFSAIMIFAAWYSSSIAPRLMARNYASIQYTREMENAFVTIYMAESAGQALDQEKAEVFDRSLKKAKENITEDGEKDALEQISSEWESFKKKVATPSASDFQNVMTSLSELTKVNERGMYTLSDRSRSLGLTIVSSGVLGLALILMYALLIADSQFERIKGGRH